MALSNKFGHLVLSTGNKSEVGAGYCTLYGDMVGGLAVISDVPKPWSISLLPTSTGKRIHSLKYADTPAICGIAPRPDGSGYFAGIRYLDGILKLRIEDKYEP